MRGRAIARASVDDDGLGTETASRTGNVDGGVTAAVDHDASAEHRRLFTFHRAQHAHRVEDVRGIPGGNVGIAGLRSADGKEDGVVAAHLHFLGEIRHLVVEFDRHAERFDAGNFLVENFAGQTVTGNPVTHHAARLRSSFDDMDGMTETCEVISGRKTGRPGADHQNATTARDFGLRESPALLERVVAEEAFHRVDADRLVKFRAIASALARVVAHAPHRSGEGIVFDDRTPGVFVVTAFGMEEPVATLFSRRALRVARRQTVDINGFHGTPGTRAVGERTPDVERDGKRFVHNRSPQIVCARSSPCSGTGTTEAVSSSRSSRPNFSMLLSAMA